MGLLRLYELVKPFLKGFHKERRRNRSLRVLLKILAQKEKNIFEEKREAYGELPLEKNAIEETSKDWKNSGFLQWLLKLFLREEHALRNNFQISIMKAF